MFLDTLIQRGFFIKMMKINGFQDDLTDMLAKKEAQLGAMQATIL